MRIAVCAADADARYRLSRLVDDALLLRGQLPEVVLFPVLTELLEATVGRGAKFDLIITEARETSMLKSLCRRSPVILVGARCDGPDAFDIGASYFVERPAEPLALRKAIEQCLNTKKGGRNT